MSDGRDRNPDRLVCADLKYELKSLNKRGAVGAREGHRQRRGRRERERIATASETDTSPFRLIRHRRKGASLKVTLADRQLAGDDVSSVAAAMEGEGIAE